MPLSIGVCSSPGADPAQSLRASAAPDHEESKGFHGSELEDATTGVCAQGGRTGVGCPTFPDSPCDHPA